MRGMMDDILRQPGTAAALLAAARRHIDAHDAQWLLLDVLDKPAAWLYLHADEALPPALGARYLQLVRRRAAGEPVAYLTGRRGFWSLDLCIDRTVLIPRPETELLVELALARLPSGRPCSVADLGTGSGAVALALARERPRAWLVAVDVSLPALTLARANARRLGIGNVDFVHGDWLAPLVGSRFDLIVGNPPYVASGDPHLRQGDLRHEPSLALVSGEDGLDAIRQIVADAGNCLYPGGALLLEHGWDQGGRVRALLKAAGFVAVQTAQDLEARDRVTFGRLAPAVADRGQARTGRRAERSPGDRA